MKTPFLATDIAVQHAWVRDLDDQTLRSGHPLLSADRAASFSLWMDRQLEWLEWRYQANVTPKSRRKSLGR